MKFASLLLFLLPSVLLGQQATPDVAISANGVQSLNLYADWPLVVHLTIMNSTRLDQSSTAPPLVIAPQGSAWTSAITFTSVSSTGQISQWPLHLIGSASSNALTLAKRSYVHVTWQMSAAEVSALAPGDYQLTASLQVSNSTGWNGIAQSGPISITVGPEPALTNDDQSRKALLLTEFSLNAGDINGAVARTQQLRLAQPSNPIAALSAANVLAIAGYPGLSVLETGNALNTYYQFNPTLSEAPLDLLNVYQGLVATLAAPTTAAPTSTLAPHASATFQPISQSVPLSAAVTSSSDIVNGGTVTFTATGIAGSATSGPVVAGSANANFTIPGGTPAATYPLQAVYSGTTVFLGSSDTSSSLSIQKATPAITWNTPASISSGTALGSAQLNATASVPGKFVYNPPPGTVLTGNSTQSLATTFTPTDSVDYIVTTASVSMVVTKRVGDVNSDGVVNCSDLAIVKASFGKKTGQTGFDSRADVNSDGIVNILDLSTVSKQLPAGTVCK